MQILAPETDVLPALHKLHLAIPVDDAKYPALHVAQAGDPANEYFPLPQSMQKEELLAPRVLEYVPAGHKEQPEAETLD